MLYLHYAYAHEIRSANVAHVLTNRQKPHPTSKTKEHVNCLERRMHSWSSEERVREGRIIQQHLSRKGAKGCDNNQRQARNFAQLMLRGKVRAALCLISNQSSTGVLRLDQEIEGTSVRGLLHPPAQPATPDTLLPLVEDTMARPL